jgi:hypothetical protein
VGQEDLRFHCFLTWCRVAVVQQTPVLIHENVPGFPPQLIERQLGRHYVCTRLQCSPSSVGYTTCSRTRVFDVLVHKERAEVPKQKPSTTMSAQPRTILAGPAAYLVAQVRSISRGPGRRRHAIWVHVSWCCSRLPS